MLPHAAESSASMVQTAMEGPKSQIPVSNGISYQEFALCSKQQHVMTNACSYVSGTVSWGIALPNLMSMISQNAHQKSLGLSRTSSVEIRPLFHFIKSGGLKGLLWPLFWQMLFCTFTKAHGVSSTGKRHRYVSIKAVIPQCLTSEGHTFWHDVNLWSLLPQILIYLNILTRVCIRLAAYSWRWSSDGQ